MFLGHFGLGLGAKKAVPAVSLGALFMACQLADLLWPTLLLLGLERVEVQPGATLMTPLDFVSYPYSHSLLTLAAWGALFGILYWIATRSPAMAGVTLALLVLSHWFLDVVTHRPDMPLTPAGTTRLGLGLWNSMPATLAIEFLIFVTGLVIYVRTTAARDRVGSAGLWSLVVFLAGGLPRQCLRTAAAGRARRGVVGPGDVAARRVGVLDRSASCPVLH